MSGPTESIRRHGDIAVVLHAAFRVARWHAGQRRKGPSGEPYVNHLLEVAHLVAVATDSRDLNLVIAALLHDAIEDQGITVTDIAAEFGADVAQLVLEVTDDKTLPRAERKRLQVEQAPNKSDRATLLMVADKISNLKALIVTPPADWPVERRLEYVSWVKHVVSERQVENPFLMEEFVSTIHAVERTVDHN